MLLVVFLIAVTLGTAQPFRWPFGHHGNQDGSVMSVPDFKLNRTTEGSGGTVDAPASQPGPNGRCQCVGTDCGCCIYMNVPRIGLNETGCVNVTYNSTQYALSFTVSLGDSIVFNRTISGKEPPRMCFSAPQIERVARLCLHFYNMSYSRDQVSGCLRIEAEVLGEVIASYELGCFNLDDIRNRIRDRLVGMKPFKAAPELEAAGIVDSGHTSYASANSR